MKRQKWVDFALWTSLKTATVLYYGQRAGNNEKAIEGITYFHSADDP